MTDVGPRSKAESKYPEEENGTGVNGTNLVSGSALAAGLAALIHDARPDASALPLRSWLKLVPFGPLPSLYHDGVKYRTAAARESRIRTGQGASGLPGGLKEVVFGTHRETNKCRIPNVAPTLEALQNNVLIS